MVKKKIYKKKNSFKDYYQSLVRIVPFSLILIFSFSVLPTLSNYFKESFKSNKIIINASKKTFDKTFNATLNNKK